MAENKAILPDNAVDLSPADRLTILKTVADETRLAILALLAEEDSYVERIAAGLSLTPATVCYHLKSWSPSDWYRPTGPSFTRSTP